jgi:hypothetical protein
LRHCLSEYGESICRLQIRHNDRIDSYLLPEVRDAANVVDIKVGDKEEIHRPVGSTDLFCVVRYAPIQRLLSDIPPSAAVVHPAHVWSVKAKGTCVESPVSDRLLVDHSDGVG